MNEESNPIKPEDVVFEPIARDIGERVVIIDGRDYATPSARIVPNTHEQAQEHEKAVHISQGKGSGVSLSLASLQAILDWAINKEGLK